MMNGKEHNKILILSYIKGDVKMDNKKYDCTMTLDYFHEKERMCNTINKNNNCNNCPLSKFYNCSKPSDKTILIVQNWSDTHPNIKRKEIPVLTNKDIIVLEALRTMGYHWIAKDKELLTDQFHTHAFIRKPELDKNCTRWISNNVESIDNEDSFQPIAYNFSFLSYYEDNESVCIDWLLRGINDDWKVYT